MRAMVLAAMAVLLAGCGGGPPRPALASVAAHCASLYEHQVQDYLNSLGPPRSWRELFGGRETSDHGWATHVGTVLNNDEEGCRVEGRTANAWAVMRGLAFRPDQGRDDHWSLVRGASPPGQAELRRGMYLHHQRVTLWLTPQTERAFRLAFAPYDLPDWPLGPGDRLALAARRASDAAVRARRAVRRSVRGVVGR